MRWALFWVTRREERLLAPFDLISSCSAYLQHLAKYDVFLCPKERLSLWGEISRCSVQISDSYLGRPHWTSLWTRRKWRSVGGGWTWHWHSWYPLTVCPNPRHTLFNLSSQPLINCFSAQNIKIQNKDTKNYFILINHWKIIFYSMEIKYIWRFLKLFVPFVFGEKTFCTLEKYTRENLFCWKFHKSFCWPKCIWSHVGAAGWTWWKPSQFFL